MAYLFNVPLEASDANVQKPKNVEDLELTENGVVNTEALALRLNYELQTRKITKRLFAEKVLNRDAKYLSSFINHPKPWAQLKSGRDICLQAMNWLALSEEDQVKVLEGNKPDFKILEKSCRQSEAPLTDDVLDYPLQDGSRIHTDRLALRIKYELQTKKISRKLFSGRVLGRCSYSLKSCLNDPKDWDELTESRKRDYQRMLIWAEMIMDDKMEVLTGERFIEDEPSDFRIPEEVLKLQLEEEEGGKVLTENVAERIYWELRVRAIPKLKFARAVLGKSIHALYKCLNEPKSWDRLHPQGRHNFRCLLAWIKLSEEQKMKIIEDYGATPQKRQMLDTDSEDLQDSDDDPGIKKKRRVDCSFID